MEYTVVFLFDHTLRNVLLLKKNKTSYKGRLNGVGGKVISEEEPIEGAVREVHEESGAEVTPQELNKLGELHIVGDCTVSGDNDIPTTLHYYAGVVPFTAVDLSLNREGELHWEPVEEVINTPVNSKKYAGDGDVQYMVYRAKLLFDRILF